MRFMNAGDIAAWRMCVGCGACAWACPDKAVRLVDFTDDGIRPVVDEGCKGCTGSPRCVQVCPGADTSHAKWDDGIDSGFAKSWGPVLCVYEGFATDPEIRFQGSSGGAATALALYCIEKEGMHGAVHAGADIDEPWRNGTVTSRRREELLERSGSRYSPASPCDGLGTIEAAPSPSVFIGKPCDVAGLRKAQKLSADLDSRIGLAISILCAGTPSTRGTLDLLAKFRKDPFEIESLRYRGNGWPGSFSAKSKSGEETLSYKEAWSFLQKYRPLRCHLCPDGTGELADISCGDPWYREADPGEPGKSLIVARTPMGKRILEAAEAAGYIKTAKLSGRHLERSQDGLLKKRQAAWGRLLALRFLMIPVPRLNGFSLFENWMDQPLKEKARSLFGTLRRALRRGYYRKARHLCPQNPIKDVSIIRKRGAI